MAFRHSFRTYIPQYQKAGCLVLAANHPICQRIRWSEIEEVVRNVPINDLVDTPGHAYYDQCELKIGENQQRIVALSLEPILADLQQIVGVNPLAAIRSKMNSFSAEQFVRTHVDKPDYSRGLVSVGMHLDRTYTGGDFAIRPLGGMFKSLKVEPHSIILWGMEVAHGVETVTSGNRVTIVHFLGPQS